MEPRNVFYDDDDDAGAGARDAGAHDVVRGARKLQLALIIAKSSSHLVDGDKKELLELLLPLALGLVDCFASMKSRALN